MLFAAAAMPLVDKSVRTAISMRSGAQRIQSGAGGMNPIRGGFLPPSFSRIPYRFATVPEDLVRCMPHILLLNYDPAFRLKDERITLCNNVCSTGRSRPVPPLRQRTPEVGGAGAIFVDTTLRALVEFTHMVDPARKAML